MTETVFTTLFTKARERLRSVARRFVAEDEVEDLLQDAFVKLWTRPDRTGSDSPSPDSSNPDITRPEGMAFITIRNLAIDVSRRAKSRPEHPLPDILAEEVEPPDDAARLSAERYELYEDVTSLISRHLSERDRMILLRRDRDGWELADIAEATGLTEANVRMVLSRGRRTIRDIYRRQNSPALSSRPTSSISNPRIKS